MYCPLLATTHRGDQHLTIGLPSIVARYEQMTESSDVNRIVVDREDMAAEFLANLRSARRTVVTVLRADQYRDLSSFTDIGDFIPLSTDQEGQVVREVAPTCIALPLAEHPGESLPLRVALIRDLRRHVPVPISKEDAELEHRWDADLDWHNCPWWESGWKATPTPAVETAPKLIPIVTTAATIDTVELARTYVRRWPAQENIIKDFLLPLGLEMKRAHYPIQESKS